MSTPSIFTVYDGTTTASPTAFSIQGIGLGASGSNTLNLAEDHLGPLCMTNGNGVLITLSTGTSAGGSGILNTFNYEGYTTAGAGSSRN